MQGTVVNDLLDLLPSDPVALVAASGATIAAILGLYIGYHAYRGLRRNGSRRMRYLSIGMILVFGVTYLLSLVGGAIISTGGVPLRYQDAFRAGIRVLQVLGLVFIAYSMRVGTAD